MDEAKIGQLQSWIGGSRRIVFFGGAGVSTESGIPDFRSVDGLYNQKYDHPPETIISHSFFMRFPEEFYRFYRDKLIVTGAKPNAAHLYVATLGGRKRRLVTQNSEGCIRRGEQKRSGAHGSLLRTTG